MHETKTKGNENESKGVQFPVAEMPLIKLIAAANRQSPVTARQFLPLYSRNTSRVLTNLNIVKLTNLESRYVNKQVLLPKSFVYI